MELLLILFLIFFGQVAGSLIGLITKPERTILYGSLAFAASMMLGISFFQLIPGGMELAPFYLVAFSFFGGMLLLWLIDKSLPHVNPELLKKEKPSIKRSVTMLVIGMALHNIPEGLAIGISFSSTPVLGILIALGIAIHDIPENIATIVPLYALTKSKGRSFLITTATILFELIGFLFGYFILSGMPPELLGMSLAITAGLMTYISLEELIPAARIRQNPKIGFTGLISGLICVLLISLLG